MLGIAKTQSPSHPTPLLSLLNLYLLVTSQSFEIFVCGDVCNLIDRNTSVSCIDEDESSEPHQNNDRIHSAHYLLMEGRGYKDLMEVLSDC